MPAEAGDNSAYALALSTYHTSILVKTAKCEWLRCGRPPES